MRLIKEGTHPDKMEWPQRVVCYNCMSEFEVDRQDCGMGHDAEGNMRYVVDKPCLVCGSVVVLELPAPKREV